MAYLQQNGSGGTDAVFVQALADALSSTPAAGSTGSGSDQAPSGAAGGATDDAQPSLGSALHGTGACMPCAWFWKPEGCRKGQACVRCHLCPRGAMRNRRKAKPAMNAGRNSAQMSPSSPHGALAQQQACTPMPAPMVAPATPGPLRAALELSTLLKTGTDRTEAHGAGYLALQQAHRPTLLTSRPEGGKPSPWMPSQMSKGFELHGMGRCRPCAWFWKPVGCQNGDACQHCHLCPEGELRARKKAKAAARLAAEASATTPLQASPMMRMTRPLIVVGEPMPPPSRSSPAPRPLPMRRGEPPATCMTSSEGYAFDEDRMPFHYTDFSDGVGRSMSQRTEWPRASDVRDGSVAHGWSGAQTGMLGMDAQQPCPWTPSSRSAIELTSSAMRRKLQNRKLTRREFEDQRARRALEPQECLEE